MAQFELANRIELKNPYINLDYYYGPYLVSAFPEVPDTGLNIDTQQAQRLIFNQTDNNNVQPESDIKSSLSDLLNAAALKCSYGDGADSAGRTIALAVSSGTKYKVKEYWLNDGKWVEKNKEPQEIDLTGYWKYSDTAFLLEEKLSNGSISKTCYTIQDGEITETVYTAKPGDVLRKLHIDGYLGSDFFLTNNTTFVDDHSFEFPGYWGNLNDLTGYVIYRGDLYRYNIPGAVDFMPDDQTINYPYDDQDEGVWNVSGWEKVTIPNNYVVYVGNNLWIPLTPSITANEGDIITDVKTSNDGTIQVTKKPLEVSEGDLITDISVENSKIQVTKKPITITGKGDTVKSVQFDENGLTVEKDNVVDHITDKSNLGHKIVYIDSRTSSILPCSSSSTSQITLSTTYTGSGWSDNFASIFCYSRDLILYGNLNLAISNLASVRITVTTNLTQPNGDAETITTKFADCTLTETNGNLLGPKSNSDSTQVIVGKYKYNIEQISKNLYNFTVWLYADESQYTNYSVYTGLRITPAVNSNSKNTAGDTASIKFEITVNGNNLFIGENTSANQSKSTYAGAVLTKLINSRTLTKPYIPSKATSTEYGYIKAVNGTIDWTDVSANKYALRTTTTGEGYVTVPAATSTTFGTIKATNNATDDSTGTKYPLKIDTSGNGYVTVPTGGGTIDLLQGGTLVSSAREDYKGYLLTGTIDGTTYNDWGKVPEAGVLCYWNGRYKNGQDGTPWSNLKYCQLGEFKNGAITKVGTNNVVNKLTTNNLVTESNLKSALYNTHGYVNVIRAYGETTDRAKEVLLCLAKVYQWDGHNSVLLLTGGRGYNGPSQSAIITINHTFTNCLRGEVHVFPTANTSQQWFELIQIGAVYIEKSQNSYWAIFIHIPEANGSGWWHFDLQDLSANGRIEIDPNLTPQMRNGDYFMLQGIIDEDDILSTSSFITGFAANSTTKGTDYTTNQFKQYLVGQGSGSVNITYGTATTQSALSTSGNQVVIEQNLKQILAQSSQVNITYGTATTQPTLSESGNKVVTEQNLKQILAQIGQTNITYGTATTRPTLSTSGNKVVTEQNLKQIIDQTIPYNGTEGWHRGLFVTQKSTDLTINPQLWSGPAFTGDTFTLLGSRGTGAIGAPETSTTHIGNLCTWANNIEFYSPSSTSTKLGNLNITSDGITYSNKITATSFYESSDKRLKDTSDYDLSLDQILSIPLVDFTWKDKRDLKHHLGTIAQDVQEVVPEIVEEDKDGMLTVEYDKFGILAIEAIRQLKDIVDKQAKEIEELKAKIK